MAADVSPVGTYTLKLAHGGANLANFRAPDLATAQTVAQSASTLFGVSLELSGDGVMNQTPTTYDPASRVGGSVTVSAPDAVFVNRIPA